MKMVVLQNEPCVCLPANQYYQQITGETGFLLLILSLFAGYRMQLTTFTDYGVRSLIYID